MDHRDKGILGNTIKVGEEKSKFKTYDSPQLLLSFIIIAMGCKHGPATAQDLASQQGPQKLRFVYFSGTRANLLQLCATDR